MEDVAGIMHPFALGRVVPPLRSCYDLEMHSQKTGVAMLASCKLDEPKVVTVYKLQIDRKILGKTFKAEQKKVALLEFFGVYVVGCVSF